MFDDDISDDYGGLYENGHWEWDEVKKGLKFVSDADVVPEEIMLNKGVPTGAIQFRDDVDFYEQLRFKHRYQRKVKSGQPEVITVQKGAIFVGQDVNSSVVEKITMFIHVQDLKDVAIFTAPTNIMTEKLINMLHRPTTERFIRALILYCQYYLQIVDIMSNRKKVFEKKVRAPQSDVIENEYRDNLCELRLLVAKQYCTMIIGGADMKYYHHMGIRKIRSLTDRDAHLYETLLRMYTQIVWLALGRKHFNLIELEISRLFKTDYYNSVERDMRTELVSNISPEERNVLLGRCRRHDTKLNTRSPLVNEVFCSRCIDYRLLTLADVKHVELTPRLKYLQQALAAPEETFEAKKTVLGILGHQRSHYDAMLNPVPIQHHHKSSSKHSGGSLNNSGSKLRKSGHDVTAAMKLFSDIDLPSREAAYVVLPDSFPDTLLPVRRCNLEQRDRWTSRLSRILNARKSTSCNLSNRN